MGLRVYSHHEGVLRLCTSFTWVWIYQFEWVLFSWSKTNRLRVLGGRYYLIFDYVRLFVSESNGFWDDSKGGVRGLWYHTVVETHTNELFISQRYLVSRSGLLRKHYYIPFCPLEVSCCFLSETGFSGCRSRQQWHDDSLSWLDAQAAQSILVLIFVTSPSVSMVQ